MCAVHIPAIIVAVLGASWNEATARCNRNRTACAEAPTTRAKDIDARKHWRLHIAPATTGCYGFDHGPVYSPKPCNFPYNCEMFDGACGHSRALAHTIDR
jgi:hypothetical protein